MATVPSSIREFLDQENIAVVGVSRSATLQAANAIWQKLEATDHHVYPVNVRADEINGRKCYRDLQSIDGRVDGVVVVTPADSALDIVKSCAELGIKRVWLHRGMGPASVSDAAVSFCREKNIDVIAGGCPMMFCEPVDFAHKCLRGLNRLAGKLPR